MTCRELIMYILENGLEDEPVVKDGKFVGFMTVPEAASEYNVGAATISTWVKLGQMDASQVGNVTYIPKGTSYMMK